MIQVLKRAPAAEDANQELVQFLEQLLARARSGETTGIVLMEIERGQSAASYSCIGVPNRWEQTGLLYNILQRINR